MSANFNSPFSPYRISQIPDGQETITRIELVIDEKRTIENLISELRTKGESALREVNGFPVPDAQARAIRLAALSILEERRNQLFLWLMERMKPIEQKKT